MSFTDVIERLEIGVGELRDWLRSERDVLVLDLRSEAEAIFGGLEKALHLPLHQLPARLSELPRNRTIVVYCTRGRRSLAAARYLRQEGFTAFSLAGGNEAWAAVDGAVCLV